MKKNHHMYVIHNSRYCTSCRCTDLLYCITVIIVMTVTVSVTVKVMIKLNLTSQQSRCSQLPAAASVIKLPVLQQLYLLYYYFTIPVVPVFHSLKSLKSIGQIDFFLSYCM